MKYHRLSIYPIVLLFLILGLSFLTVLVVAQEATQEPDMAEATEEVSSSTNDEELIAHGEYLVSISRCISCHTPRLEEFGTEELSIEQRVTLSLDAADALNTEELLLAGGRVFNLGPAGTVIGSNITPDEETGIGRYTDEELEILLRLGVKSDGTSLHRIMPFASYSKWSAEDMAAMIAYLRSIPAIENDVGESTILRDEFEGDPVEALIELDFPEESPQAAIERGEYLVVNVMRCTGCHTPRDPETGRPDNSQYLGGGQAYEGEWGIVYGSNISPHPETGLGAWADQDIQRVLQDGLRIDGRRLVFMPWQDFASISDDDVTAVIAYLRSVEAIDNEVPLPAINDDFIQTVDIGD